MNAPDKKSGDAKESLLGQSVLIELAGLVIEVAAALQSNSLSLYADLIQEGVETLATIVAWGTLRHLRRHHYEFDFGLGKVESLLGLVVAGGMAVSVYSIAHEALARLAAPQPLEKVGLGLAMIVAWIGVDGYYWWKFVQLDRQHPSPVLEATGKSYRAGTVVCVALTATLLAGKLLEDHPWALYIDPLVSLGYAVYMLKTIYEITARALGDLTDCTLDETLQLAIVRELARFFHDYRLLHDVKSRRSGGTVQIELHLEFHPDQKMSEVYEVSERMSASLQAKIRGSRVIIVPARRKTAPQRREP
ncbi:MAG: cation diffusion facilitator family transporter [Elusimicrobia bacterium]|nr:cation diffusion facilitator family transporter [Elusimicrobiota bacterium]